MSTKNGNGFVGGASYRVIKSASDHYHGYKVGEVVTNVQRNSFRNSEGLEQYLNQDEVELVTNKGGTKVSERKRHLYRLKKDSIGALKGLVVREDCDDGTQGFTEFDLTAPEGIVAKTFRRDEVVDNPEWFEEVTIEYVPVKTGARRGRKPGSKNKPKVSRRKRRTKGQIARAKRNKDIRQLYKNGMPATEIAGRSGLAVQTIYAVLSRRQKQ